MIRLSILILTIPAREKLLAQLLYILRPQITDEVEVLLNRNPGKSIGAKRNALLLKAQGEYITFIDDDDCVARDYVERILKAIGSGPDCVGISGIITQSGRERKWHISKEYGSWHQEGKGKDLVYYRTPNHISPVKRSIALQAMFPETNHGEDAAYSALIYPLLHTEVRIPGIMYIYRYVKK